jgi:hypothetical protein
MARAPSTNSSWALLGELWDRFDADPAWIPAETEAIIEAIHRELGLEDDPDLRDLTYRSTEAVIRLGLQLVHTSTTPDAAKSPPAAVEYARELVHRGIPLDALLRAHQIGHRVFYERFAARVRAELPTPDQLANALEQAAMWTHALLAGQSRRLAVIYTEEREQWARSAGAWRAEVVRAILAGQPAGPEAEQRLG